MRINRTNPEQPAVQPVQSHAPLKAQTEVNGFELPEQEIPKENQKEPPKAAKPPKPKKEKPAKKPRRQPVEEVEDDEENEQPRRRFPFGCLIVLVILALVGFGGYKVSQFYAELDGQKTLGPTQTITVPEGSSVAGIATQLKDAGVIEYDWLFKQYVKYSGKAGEIQYGDFEVQSGMAYNDIIKALSVVTRRATVNVTIPEGTTAVGVAQIFVDAGLVDDVDTFLSCANGNDGTDWSKYDFWNAIPDNDRLMKCEGYLFPDTYNLYKDESVDYYVDALYGEFASKTAARRHGRRQGHEPGRRGQAGQLHSGGGRFGERGRQGQRLLPQPPGIQRPAVGRAQAGIQCQQLYHAGQREQLSVELPDGGVLRLAGAGRDPRRRAGPVRHLCHQRPARRPHLLPGLRRHGGRAEP